jgi:hypothetical protein
VITRGILIKLGLPQSRPAPVGSYPVELLARHISRYEESDLSRLLLEISLLELAYRNGEDSDGGVLVSTAKRYRIDLDKCRRSSLRSSQPDKRRERRDQPPSKDEHLINSSGARQGSKPRLSAVRLCRGVAAIDCQYDL